MTKRTSKKKAPQGLNELTTLILERSYQTNHHELYLTQFLGVSGKAKAIACVVYILGMPILLSVEIIRLVT